MNKFLKYLGYLVAFIIAVFVLLNVLDKMCVGCLFLCEGDKGPVIQYEDRYYDVDGKRVK